VLVGKEERWEEREEGGREEKETGLREASKVEDEEGLALAARTRGRSRARGGELWSSNDVTGQGDTGDGRQGQLVAARESQDPCGCHGTNCCDGPIRKGADPPATWMT
jgi:hypothetical protein